MEAKKIVKSEGLISEQVKDIIVERILSGELRPGRQVVESAIARELEISQAPVREAVRELTIGGFLEYEPYKGTFVRSFSSEELFEVYSVRAALESLAAKTAALHITDEDGKILRDLLDGMIEAARNDDTREMTRLDNEFHRKIIRVSGNKLLLQFWSTLQFGYWTIATARISGMDLEYLATRHEELLEAVMSKDPLRAADAMQRHIEDLGKPRG
jgi:DNA-binding GntR family transcriptional regulator